MSARPWYKRYGADFITGTLELSLEEKGAYSICLDLIYDRGKAIPDDPQWISRACGCSVRKWKTIRQKLIDKGKIFERDGQLDNFRAEKNRENDAKEARKLAENGAKGGEKTAEKRAELNKITELAVKGPPKTKRHTRSQKPEARKKEDTGFKKIKSVYPDRGGKPMGWKEAEDRIVKIISLGEHTLDELVGAAKGYRRAMEGKKGDEREGVQKASTFFGPVKQTYLEYIGAQSGRDADPNIILAGKLFKEEKLGQYVDWQPGERERAMEIREGVV